jgi:sigma-B regulation protein RsbU (phosphoserine phosphatase)
LIRLGSVSVSHALGVNEARDKVRQVVETLTGDSITATRLASATSQLCRTLQRETNEPSVSLALWQERGISRLGLTFEALEPVPGADLLAGFFDAVEVPPRSDGRHRLLAVKNLPVPALPGEVEIARLRAILERKGVDELMEELQVKNRELRESFENLKRTTSAKERMESELNIGRDIQMSMLPLVFPAFPHRQEFSVFAALHPAREVGGDFYDFFLIDEDRFCFCVGDVSGKGVPAALFMAVTKTLIKSRASNDFSPASIMTHVNDEVGRHNESCMFVTIFLGILDVTTGQLAYTNAGHNPPYLKREDGTLVRLDKRHGPVIGAMEGMVYHEDSIGLGPGDMLLVYTDGVTEAMDPSQSLYEEEQLVELYGAREYASAEDLVQATVDDVWRFQAEAVQADDVTVLAVEYFGVPESAKRRVLDITIKNDLNEIMRVNESFNAFAGEQGVPDSTRRQMNLVFDELLNNVISYAYQDDEEHDIGVVVELSSDRLAVTITDDGIPFNPFQGSPPDTALSIEERQIGGLGIHLVQNVMDEVSYNRRTNENVVILAKHLKPSGNDEE